MMRRFVGSTLLIAVLLSGMLHSTAQATDRSRPPDGCWDPTPCPISLYEVDMLSANEGWAVGESGLILRWNGLRWRPQPSPTTQALSAVAMVSPNDGWAAGATGTLLRWNGREWAPHAIGTAATIFDIDMRSATDGWLAAGTSIWRWDGTEWSKRSEVGAYAISAFDATTAWAAGTPLLRWTGSQWQAAGGGAMNNYAIKMVAANEAWVGGMTCLNEVCGGRQLVLQRWNGSAWGDMLPFTEGQISDIDGVSRTAVWAVGELDTGGGQLVILHWNGDSLTTTNIGMTLYSLSMTSADNGWAVGYQGTVVRWDGVTWGPYVPAYTRTYIPLLGR